MLRPFLVDAVLLPDDTYAVARHSAFKRDGGLFSSLDLFLESTEVTRLTHAVVEAHR